MIFMLDFGYATGAIVANDVENSRSIKIAKMIDEYIPKGSPSHQSIKTMSVNARNWEDIESGVYDKVGSLLARSLLPLHTVIVNVTWLKYHSWVCESHLLRR